MRRYDASEIEPKWVERWEAEGLYRASEDPADPRPRFYALDMFSYPSGDLHMGHAEAFSGGDAVARFAAMRGYNVLHPIGWDAFGLPAENAAIKRGIHPKEWTYANIEQQARSFRRMGMSFDWTRRINTCDPEYYRWTQWLFLRLFERGLAYRKNAPVNWCPKDADGPGERAGDQRRVRAVRDAGRAQGPHPVVLQDHRLRAAAARRHASSLDWPERVHDDAAQLDRALGGRVRRRSRSPRPATPSRCSRRAPTRCGASRSSCSRLEHPLVPKLAEAGGTRPRSRRCSRPCGRRPWPTASRRRAARAIRAGRQRGEPGERGEGPGLRRALRADGVRHRRRDGGAGARPARLRVRARPRPADPRGRAARRRAA